MHNIWDLGDFVLHESRYEQLSYNLKPHIVVLKMKYLQGSKLQNLKANVVCGTTPELRRSSSFDSTWEENVAECVADELVIQVHSSSASTSRNGSLAIEQQDESTRNKSKETKSVKPSRSSHEEKKVGKTPDEKRSRPRKMREFHNIKISQVCSVSFGNAICCFLL